MELFRPGRIGLAAAVALVGLAACGSHHHGAVSSGTTSNATTGTVAVGTSTTKPPTTVTPAAHRRSTTSTTKARSRAPGASTTASTSSANGGSVAPTMSVSHPTTATASTAPSPAATTPPPTSPRTTPPTTRPPTTTTTLPRPVAVSIVGLQFQPETLTVAPGTTITWTNKSTVPHTVVRCDSTHCPVGPGTGTDPAFGSGLLAAGQTFSVTFHSPGTYNYYCTVHGYPLMHGTITVT